MADASANSVRPVDKVGGVGYDRLDTEQRNTYQALVHNGDLIACRNPFTEPRMRHVSRFAFRHLVLPAVSILAAGVAGAATYLPLSDEELAARSPVIVRAR